jgi:hypothetical protein
MDPHDDALVERVRARMLHQESRPEPPASHADVASTEAKLDAPLPSLLRRLYLEVANGGFGPRYGVLGVRGGFRSDSMGTLDEAYRMFRQERWPIGVLPMIDYGCTQLICLAIADAAGTIAIKDDQNQLWRTEFTLEWMFDAWCDGRDVWLDMHEEVGVSERQIINPFTRQRQILRKPKRRVRGTPWPRFVRGT